MLALLQRSMVLFLGLLFFSAPAWATWSIVVLNRVTGEVAVATSTCLANLDISRFVPVIRVGEGAGAAQSFVNPAGTNRRLFFDNVGRPGASPWRILAAIQLNDPGFQSRQFGFVGIGGSPVTFSGTQNFQTALGVTGQVGDYEYAIQGNILTGANVVMDCETAFRTTQGDLAERLIVAMEAARDAGGDGRCSCSQSAPTSCGSPPANFTYASLNGFMAIARMGDTDGVCNGSQGCATGNYYMRLNYVGNTNTQEPIAALRDQYTAWRAGLVGRPDHILSEVQASMPVLQADQWTASRVTVRLRDVDGTALTNGGQAVSVVLDEGDAVATVSGIVDNGDGTHSFDLTATNVQGLGRFAITVDDGIRPVRLHPTLEVRSVAPSTMHLGNSAYSAMSVQGLTMIADFSSLGAAAGDPYMILGSLSGTQPGTVFGGALVPLNRDRLFEFTAVWVGGLPLAGGRGTLDANQRAQAMFALPPGALLPFVGQSVSFAGMVQGSAGPVVTEAGSALIEP